MYRKMLVLLDGSKLAEVVFTYAQELAGRLNIDLDLLHVCSPQEAEQLPMRKAYMEHKAEDLRREAEQIRTASAYKAEDKGIKAKGTVVVGYPADEILKYVDENNVDMIMLSTHGRSGMKAWNLGSVANKVIHGSRVPIWLVPAELREEIIKDQIPRRTIVMPLDGSKLSAAVIPHAINIAKQRGAESQIVVLYVDDSNLPVFVEQWRQQEDKRLSISKYLDTIVKTINDAGISARSEVLKGVPSATIIDFVAKNSAQLIAMATHGHLGLSRMIFGSVTENILQLVKKTPILLVGPYNAEKDISI